MPWPIRCTPAARIVSELVIANVPLPSTIVVLGDSVLTMVCSPATSPPSICTHVPVTSAHELVGKSLASLPHAASAATRLAAVNIVRVMDPPCGSVPHLA